MQDKNPSETISVYYDGICNLCSKEISYYKKIAPPLTFNWIDIARNGKALEAYNIKQETALKYLHVIDTSGKLFVGVDAFEIMWRHLPFWKILALLLKLPPIKYLAKIIYASFAQRRFEKSDHCQLISKTNK